MRTASRLPNVASTSGAGDALDDLERDHRQVETMFARASLTTGEHRARLVRYIAYALTVHAELEEKVVYRAIAATVGSGELLIDRAEDEHDEMKQIIARLAKANGDEVELVDDLRALQLVVLQHVAVEEGSVFPAFREAATTAAMTDLETKAAKARAAAPPPPEEGGESIAELVGEAVAGVVGKVREVMTGDGAKSASKRASAAKKSTTKATSGPRKAPAAQKRSSSRSTTRGAR